MEVGPRHAVRRRWAVAWMHLLVLVQVPDEADEPALGVTVLLARRAPDDHRAGGWGRPC